jgi:hypothetical protein
MMWVITSVDTSHATSDCGRNVGCYVNRASRLQDVINNRFVRRDVPIDWLVMPFGWFMRRGSYFVQDIHVCTGETVPRTSDAVRNRIVALRRRRKTALTATTVFPIRSARTMKCRRTYIGQCLKDGVNCQTYRGNVACSSPDRSTDWSWWSTYLATWISGLPTPYLSWDISSPQYQAGLQIRNVLLWHIFYATTEVRGCSK